MLELNHELFGKEPHAVKTNDSDDSLDTKMKEKLTSADLHIVSNKLQNSFKVQQPTTANLKESFRLLIQEACSSQ